MFFKFLFFSLLFFVFGEIKFNCTVTGNALIHWKDLDNGRVYFQISTPSKNGWSAIGFGKNNTLNEAYSILYYRTNTSAEGIQFQNHTFIDEKQIFADLTNDFEFPNDNLGAFFDTFSFTLPKENLTDLNYLFIAYRFRGRPNSIFDIPRHTRTRTTRFTLKSNFFFLLISSDSWMFYFIFR